MLLLELIPYRHLVIYLQIIKRRVYYLFRRVEEEAVECSKLVHRGGWILRPIKLHLSTCKHDLVGADVCRGFVNGIKSISGSRQKQRRCSSIKAFASSGWRQRVSQEYHNKDTLFKVEFKTIFLFNGLLCLSSVAFVFAFLFRRCWPPRYPLLSLPFCKGPSRRYGGGHLGP